MAILGCAGRAERKMPAALTAGVRGEQAYATVQYLVRDLLVLDLDERVVMSARSGGIHVWASRVAELIEFLLRNRDIRTARRGSAVAQNTTITDLCGFESRQRFSVCVGADIGSWNARLGSKMGHDYRDWAKVIFPAANQNVVVFGLEERRRTGADFSYREMVREAGQSRRRPDNSYY